MTDITELTQREKFEAWARSQQLSIAYGDCGYVYSSTEMAWRAVKALSADLVEALEKSESRLHEVAVACATAEQALEKAQAENTAGVAGMAESYETTISMLRSRIAELEASHTKLRESMAAIHNTISLDGAGTSLATILNAAKRAYEESASVAGIKLDVQPAQPCEHSMFWDASGVKRCSKCDMPEHANVHYADAAEMEIAALRQRIAELESRTVKLPKPHAHLIWIQAGHAPDDFWDDVAVSHSEKDRCCDGSERYPVYARWEIEEMLTASGIKWEAE
ncbi:TPA: hypothetical protein ACQ299_000403 [Klebsiella pneumoniae]